MNRRNFLRTMIGGVAATAAVRTFPFRVYSFPSQIEVPSFSDRVGMFDFDGTDWRWTSLNGKIVRHWNLPPIGPKSMLQSNIARQEIAVDVRLLAGNICVLTPPR